MSSEKRLGISAQPSDTCPMIDKVIESVNEFNRITRGYERCEDLGELRNMIDRIDSELFWSPSIDRRMEEIRAHVIKIRAWGQEWKDKALELEKELNEVNVEMVA